VFRFRRLSPKSDNPVVGNAEKEITVDRVALNISSQNGHTNTAANKVSADDFDSTYLTQIVKSLLSAPHTSTAALIADRFSIVETSAETQLSKLRDRYCSKTLQDVHYALFLLQQVHFAEASDHRSYFQFDPIVVWLREKLQDWWLASEEKKLSLAVPGVEDFVAHLKTLCLGHPGAQHPLFDFLEREATVAQLVAFMESDAQLNTRFFDLIAYCLIGTNGLVKAELAQNLWDEAGRGDPQAAHVEMFEKILADFTVTDDWRDGSTSDWEGLAGHNLFVTLCVGRKHQYKALGLMAATELIDPASYSKLAAGCRRLAIPVPAYYSEHIEIDVVHGDGWLVNVIAPLVHQAPEIRAEIALGAALRMASCQLYYDRVLENLRAVTH